MCNDAIRILDERILRDAALVVRGPTVGIGFLVGDSGISPLTRTIQRTRYRGLCALSPSAHVERQAFMSCVLRVTADGLAEALSRMRLKAYRFERGTAHFQVSECDFDNLGGQVRDAAAFLHAHEADLTTLLGTPRATGVLDFAVEVVAAEFGSARFPSNLVRVAGSLGLALQVSQYPAQENE